jgi:hypothetical protein
MGIKARVSSQERSMTDSLDAHYPLVLKAITEGRLIPFFGAGANLCGRPTDAKWQQGTYLPSGGELSEHLAKNFAYLESDRDLARVSQYVELMAGSAPLYEELRELLDADYPPTCLHQFFATLPAILRAKHIASPHQLIVTTNYDDLMERAFQAANESFDVVSYIAESEQRGKFLHYLPNGDVKLIDRPNEYRDLSLDQRPIILKIHGAIDRANADRDSFVITEDHYIDFLSRTDISTLIPVTLAAKLRKSHFLFLGYSHRIWGEQRLSYKSWAIQLKPTDLDKRFWAKRDVDILDIPLDQYVAGLDTHAQALPIIGGTP